MRSSGAGLVYAAETRIPGGVAAVVFGTLPPVTAVSTLLAGIERPRAANPLASNIPFLGAAAATLAT